MSRMDKPTYYADFGGCRVNVWSAQYPWGDSVEEAWFAYLPDGRRLGCLVAFLDDRWQLVITECAKWGPVYLADLPDGAVLKPEYLPGVLDIIRDTSGDGICLVDVHWQGCCSTDLFRRLVKWLRSYLDAEAGQLVPEAKAWTDLADDDPELHMSVSMADLRRAFEFSGCRPGDGDGELNSWHFLGSDHNDEVDELDSPQVGPDFELWEQEL